MNQFDRPELQDVTQQRTLIHCYCRTMPVSCTESEIIIFLNDELKKGRNFILDYFYSGFALNNIVK